MKKILVFPFLCFLMMNGKYYAQVLDKNKNYVPVAIGFWNMENFYDTINDPAKNDEEFLPGGSYKWDSFKYNDKMKHMSDIISQLAADATPDGVAIMGMCEIENDNVLNDLVKTPKLKGRNYKVVYINGPDARGVDVALIYNPKYFKLKGSKAFPVQMITDTAYKTRDELLVSGELLGEKFHFIVCHWPSRRGGEKVSEPNRISAAKTAKIIIDSLLKEDEHAKVILMGDLNDDPVDVSVKKTLVTNADFSSVKKGELFNAMEKLFKKGVGSLAYNNEWNLFDQEIMTQALTKGDYKDLQFYVSHVFNKPIVTQQGGTYNGYPFRTYSGREYIGGYSDHYSVYSILMREMKADPKKK